MAQHGVLRRDDINEFITTLYDGDVHARRVPQLSNATVGVLTSASLAVQSAGVSCKRWASSASTESSRSIGC